MEIENIYTITGLPKQLITTFSMYIIKLRTVLILNTPAQTSRTDVWKSSLRTPWRSSSGNIGRRDGNKTPFSSCNKIWIISRVK